jgi:hypothetical protein
LDLSHKRILANYIQWKLRNERFQRNVFISMKAKGRIFSNMLCVTRVEAGSNTSTVTLRVVGGDEKGSLKCETVKYGCESEGTWTREGLRWQRPAAYTKDRPNLSSEGAPHKNKTVTITHVIKIWSEAPDGCSAPRQTGRLTVGRNIRLRLRLSENENENENENGASPRQSRKKGSAED